MPFKDGTGPLGQGSMTGRGMGMCGCGQGMGRVGHGMGFGMMTKKNRLAVLKEVKENMEEYMQAMDEEIEDLGKGQK